MTDLGARVVGDWPSDGYEFNASAALQENRFVGLVLDQDNQHDLTEQRLDNWLAQIKSTIL